MEDNVKLIQRALSEIVSKIIELKEKLERCKDPEECARIQSEIEWLQKNFE